MKKKDVIALSIIAAVFVFGGVGGFAWQIVKFRLDPPDFAICCDDGIWRKAN